MEGFSIGIQFVISFVSDILFYIYDPIGRYQERNYKYEQHLNLQIDDNDINFLEAENLKLKA